MTRAGPKLYDSNSLYIRIESHRRSKIRYARCAGRLRQAFAKGEDCQAASVWLLSKARPNLQNALSAIENAGKAAKRSGVPKRASMSRPLDLSESKKIFRLHLAGEEPGSEGGPGSGG
jgi:hypothetical protein